MAGPGSPSITPATRFNLASASKMFTAVAIGQLIDGGRLRLDQPVGEIVAGLTPEAARVTIRQLLTHTSGLGDFFRPENMAMMMKARRADDILPLIAGERPAFAPGSRFAYSNSGFALLGVVIERISEQSYPDYLRQHVFAPAGMTATSADPAPLGTLAIGMTAHDPGGGAGALHPAPGAADGHGSPAGGLFGTTDDLLRFATALDADRLLSRATTAAFTSAQIEAFPATATRSALSYGYGFGVSEQVGYSWFGHNGGTFGANTEFAVRRDGQWVVAVVSNRDPPVATALMHEIQRLIDDAAPASTCGALRDKS